MAGGSGTGGAAALALAVLLALGGCAPDSSDPALGPDPVPVPSSGELSTAAPEVVVSGGADAAVMAAHREAAVQALAAVEEWWGQGSVPRPLRVELPADAEAFVRSTGVSDTGVPALVLGEGLARRVVVHPEAAGRLTPEGLLAVMTHEVSHLAMDAGQAPWWLVEGMAEHTAHRHGRLDPIQIAGTGLAQVRAGQLPQDWPAPDPGDRWRGYTLAWLACLYLAQTYSEDDLMALFTAAADGRPLEAVFPEVLGVQEGEALAGYRRWLQELATPQPR